MENKQKPVQELSFLSAIRIVNYCEQLERLKKYSIGNQLIRSGTSIGANITESQHSESKADFIHKMKIADKEAAETGYWLKICNAINDFPNCEELIKDLIPIQKLLSVIISRCKQNMKLNK